MIQYMVTIDLPEELDEDFTALIPDQRALVDSLMASGVILNYSLSMDRTMLWVTFLCKNQSEVIKNLKSFPIYDYISYEIHELAFYNYPAIGIPAISLN